MERNHASVRNTIIISSKEPYGVFNTTPTKMKWGFMHISSLGIAETEH